VECSPNDIAALREGRVRPDHHLKDEFKPSVVQFRPKSETPI
jgi:hypothetical protein